MTETDLLYWYRAEVETVSHLMWFLISVWPEWHISTENLWISKNTYPNYLWYRQWHPSKVAWPRMTVALDKVGKQLKTFSLQTLTEVNRKNQVHTKPKRVRILWRRRIELDEVSNRIFAKKDQCITNPCPQRLQEKLKMKEMQLNPYIFVFITKWPDTYKKR